LTPLIRAWRRNRSATPARHPAHATPYPAAVERQRRSVGAEHCARLTRGGPAAASVCALLERESLQAKSRARPPGCKHEFDRMRPAQLAILRRSPREADVAALETQIGRLRRKTNAGSVAHTRYRRWHRAA